MPYVDLGDGRLLDVPDDASPEMLQGIRDKLKASGQFTASTKVPEPPGFLESTARDLASGFGRMASTVARGGAMLAGTFGGVDEEGQKAPGTTMAPRTNSLARTLTDAADSAEQYWTGVGNKSTNSDLGKMTVRGAGGSLLVPTPQSFVSGMGGGAGEYVADKLDGGHDNPLMRTAGNVVGSVLAGTGYGLAARARPQTAAIAREGMEGLTEQQLMAAQDYKNSLAKQNINIDLAQALEATSGHSGNLSSIRDFLAGRRQGNTVQSTLRGQPEQLATEANLTVGSLPGKNYNLEQNATNVQQIASQLIQDAKTSRSSAVRDLYAKAGDLPDDIRAKLGAVLNQYATQPGATEVLKARAREFAAKLSGDDGTLTAAVTNARDQLAKATSASEKMAAQKALQDANAALSASTGKPLKALDVDTWINELRGPYQGQPLKVAYPKEQGQVKGLTGALNQVLQDASPEIRAAEAKFGQISRDVVDPLKQGPIGQLAQPRGYDPATQAMVSKFEGLMNRGSDPTAQVSSIRTAARELNAKDPEVFADAFKGWLSRKVQGATEASGGGNTQATTDPATLRKAIFGDPLQWQGIKDATAEIAKVHGVPPEEMIRGLENLRQLTTAMGNRPGSVGGLSPSDLAQLGGASNTANLVRVASFLPVNRVGEAIERATLGKTLSQLDTILTSEEGAKMLIKLGRVPVMSRAAQTILGSWGAAYGNAGGLPGNNTGE